MVLKLIQDIQMGTILCKSCKFIEINLLLYRNCRGRPMVIFNVSLRPCSVLLADGRGKKKKYAEYLYLAALVAAVVIPMKLQGLALVAGKALLIAKVALALAGAALLKKLGHDEHHRRVDVEGDPYLLAYREHT